MVAAAKGTSAHASTRRWAVGLALAGSALLYVERQGFPVALALAAPAGVDKATLGRAHAAFYWGYIATQLPGGYAAARYGAAKVLLAAFIALAAAVGVAQAPLLAYGDTGLKLRAARAVVGAASGAVFPAFHALLASWVPATERSRAVALFTSGMYFGSALAVALVPASVGSVGAANQQRLVSASALGFAALVRWKLWAADESGGRVDLLPTEVARSAARHRPLRVPWAALARCVPLYAIVFSNYAFHFAFFVIMSWLPEFLAELDVPGSASAASASSRALPYLVMGACANAGGVLADALVSRGTGVTSTRKALNTAGFLAAAAGLSALPLAGSRAPAVALSSLSLGALAFSRAGFAVNHMDIAPRLAGPVMGLSNGAGSLAGTLAPWVTGLLLDRGGGGPAVWVAAFQLPAFVCIAAAAVFATFATGKRLFD